MTTPPPAPNAPPGVGTLALLLATFTAGLTCWGLYELWGTPLAAPVALAGGLVTALTVLAGRLATRNR